jgi:hypothetical protein
MWSNIAYSINGEKMKIWKSKKTTVVDIVDWITDVFKEAELDLSEYAVPDVAYTWVTYIDEIQLYIKIDTSDPEANNLILDSCLCEIPTKEILPFYRKCLDMNSLFLGGCLTLDETRVSFVQRRTIENMNEAEFGQIIGYQMSVSEQVLKELNEEFKVVPKV